MGFELLRALSFIETMMGLFEGNKFADRAPEKENVEALHKFLNKLRAPAHKADARKSVQAPPWREADNRRLK